MVKPPFLVVDADAYPGNEHLDYLCAFDGVNGVRIESAIRLEERGTESRAIIGDPATRVHALRPLGQFREFAQKMANGVQLFEDELTRAMGFAYLAEQWDADFVVSPVRFPEADIGLLRARVITMDQALATIGAHVRQTEEVALAGTPALRQERTFVYPMTARLIVPDGQRFWEWCVAQKGARDESFLGYAEAIFKRLGQALRGRDAVHEALRAADGPSGISDALYHLDPVFTSAVAALDSLARVANDALGLGLTGMDVAWQRKKFGVALQTRSSAIADTIATGTVMGVVLRLVTTARNTIHGIPLDEYLKVVMPSTVEHRVMVFSDAANALRATGASQEVLKQFGLHLDGESDVNVGRLVEEMLAATIRLVGALAAAILHELAVPRKATVFEQDDGDELFALIRRCCIDLAHVGSYPYRSAPGLPARHSVRLETLGAVHRARERLIQKRQSSTE